MRKTACLVLAATLAGAASPAIANEVTIKIDLGELDIANPSDDAAIRDRIAAQVNKACNRFRPVLSSSGAIEDCKADGIGKALDEVEARRALIAAN